MMIHQRKTNVLKLSDTIISLFCSCGKEKYTKEEFGYVKLGYFDIWKGKNLIGLKSMINLKKI